MNEILAAHPNLTERELRSSGLQIGKNIIGTTVNTLVFIAFGETIMLCLLYISNGYSLVMLINSKSFFQQFGGILFSCQSCLLVVPLTAAIFARMPISARFIANKAGYQFKHREIGELLKKLAEVTESDPNL